MAPASMNTAPYKVLLENNPNSDFIIRCENREWKVNKCFLEARSEFFNAAVNGSFKEAQEGVLILNEEEPETVQRLLDFIYCGDYHEPNEITSSSNVRSRYCAACGPDGPCDFCDVRDDSDDLQDAWDTKDMVLRTWIRK
jgi:hypothetical protein